MRPGRRRGGAIRFTKMHGLGNDFMVIDGISQSVNLTGDQVRQWSDRNLGVGFDQLLLVEPPGRPDVDFRYRIFNADGGEVEQCGNGARCFARFVIDQQLTQKRRIRVETRTGIIELDVADDGEVTVDMGAPRLAPDDVPFIAPEQAPVYEVEANGQVWLLSAVSMGNPHGVMIVDNVDEVPVADIGPALEGHDRFPARANIGFMQICSRERIRLRVFERGVGETRACGTGACAAVVAGRLRGLLDERVEVLLPGGDLTITWSGDGAPVMMKGPATRVFEGQVRIADERGGGDASARGERREERRPRGQKSGRHKGAGKPRSRRGRSRSGQRKRQ